VDFFAPRIAASSGDKREREREGGRGREREGEGEGEGWGGAKKGNVVAAPS